MQQNQTEIWKPVVGYEGLYEVSNIGRIRSLDKIGYGGRLHKGMVKSTPIGNHGYRFCLLQHCGKRKLTTVHRAVAQAFIENPKNYPFVNHIDSDRTNNLAINLEWCTPLENIWHSRSKGRMRSGQARFKIDNDLVERMRYDHENKKLSYAKLSAIYGFSSRQIWIACTGKPRGYSRIAKGWEFVKNINDEMIAQIKNDLLTGMTVVDAAEKNSVSYGFCKKIFKELHG